VEKLKELKQQMSQERPHPWEELPDLALYMDQVLAYMPRQLIHLNQEDVLTSAMVNNYIKDGLVPRASGKKYSQVHLAYLTAICALKQVLSVKEAHTLIAAAEQITEAAEHQEAGVHQMYDRFCGLLDEALTDTADSLTPDVEEADLPELALQLALRSYADQLACRRVLAMLAKEEVPEAKTERAEKKARKEKNKKA
jgi:hypothetical protein